MKGPLTLTIWLLFASVAVAASNDVIGRITSDGSVTIEGQKYSDPVRLKAKLDEVSKRTPAPRLHLVGDPKLPWKTASAAASLVQRAGWKLPLGVIVEPKPVDGPKQ
jgi:hypothetical protein